jgi:hypothetical protein
MVVCVLAGAPVVMAVGCSFLQPLSVAVENRDAVPYLLRVVDGRHRAWMVPAVSSGLGPTNDGSETRSVLISGMDCSEIERLGLSTGDVTLFVEGGHMADPDLKESIASGLPRLEQIVDPCE